MDAPEQTADSGGKRHSRNISFNRALARRSTKGPLDAIDDPLAPETPNAGSTVEAVNTPIPDTPFSPERASAKPIILLPLPPSKDYSYLLRPDIYHPLSNLDLPGPFRTAHHQPSPSTPLQSLLANHHYRSAATACAIRLTTPPAPPQNELFSLLYTRLACLTLINHVSFAAEEAKALEDVNSAYYRDEGTGRNILPWELRVLVVRLQGIAFADGRRGIGGYYDLARVARLEARKAKSTGERDMWQQRLQELGLCVTNALVELGDLGAAIQHLKTLRGNEDDSVVNGRLALLYLRLGGIDAARRTLGDEDNPAMRALFSMASGDYDLAVSELRALPSSDLVSQNLAVCLFYTGKVDETIELLEGLVDKGRSFHTLTFNLATCYELTSERGQMRKAQLVEKVADNVRETGGGERQAGDFKL